MNVYGVRMYFSLRMLLLAATGLAAQPTERKANVSWESPLDDSGQPFRAFAHYRLYVCNKPIQKKNNKVMCRSNKLDVHDVDKDQLEATIVYKLSNPQDTMFVRAVTRNRKGIESALSDQVELKPLSPDPGNGPEPIGRTGRATVSLANSFYLLRASEDFKQTHAVTHLWNRCMEKAPACTAGSDQSNTVWIEFDFKRPYRLQDASLYGDADGKWQSWSWSLSHKLEKDDSWQVAFSGASARVTNWVRQDLGRIRARYVRVEIFGDPKTTTVQARELEILGIKN
ncbi:hypothetical protein C2W62_16430 [Candidatus Entotheonella serta]|nr:hypothetical protein C2W62_16430 [Candidatus Entotheonella serta]